MSFPLEQSPVTGKGEKETFMVLTPAKFRSLFFSAVVSGQDFSLEWGLICYDADQFFDAQIMRFFLHSISLIPFLF